MADEEGCVGAHVYVGEEETGVGREGEGADDVVPAGGARGEGRGEG